MLWGYRQVGHLHWEGDGHHRFFKSLYSVRKANAKMNACFIDHLLCASPACQEKVREQQKVRRGRKGSRGKREDGGVGGGRRKGRIEKETGRKRKVFERGKVRENKVVLGAGWGRS